MTDDGLIGGRDEDAHYKQGFGIDEGRVKGGEMDVGEKKEVR
jgi:hypothetical protein